MSRLHFTQNELIEFVKCAHFEFVHKISIDLLPVLCNTKRKKRNRGESRCFLGGPAKKRTGRSRRDGRGRSVPISAWGERLVNRMRQLRQQQGISMMEAARRLKLPYTTYVNYEKGAREPSHTVMLAISEYYGVTVDYLLGGDVPSPRNILPMPKMQRIPLLGTIACGEPILAHENQDGTVDLPRDIHADFALRCRGDSMVNARIFDGDIVYIRQQDTVENGQIAAVLIDDEATLKRVHLYEDHIVLSPENPMYRPFSYWGEDMNQVRILGLAVAFTSTLL